MPDPDVKIIISEDRTPTIIIITIILVVIIVFFVYLFYSVLTSSKVNIGPTYKPCDPGKCATNLITGEKRCPSGTDSIDYDLSHEVCNSEFECDNPITPYSLNSDLGTSPNGICEPGVRCRCLRQPQCPQHITNVWTARQGSPFIPFDEQRINFIQSEGAPPIQTSSDQFCSIPMQWLVRSIPGCGFEEMNSDTIKECMSPSGAILRTPPCLTGKLAFLPRDANKFTALDINLYPVGCVGTSKVCPKGTVSVWDNKISDVRCISI